MLIAAVMILGMAGLVLFLKACFQVAGDADDRMEAWDRDDLQPEAPSTIAVR